MTRGPDIEAVTALLGETADALILPRFRRLQAGEIERKPTTVDPLDIVTVVDREVEARLTHDLAAMMPGSITLGEEAAHAQPALLGATASDAPLWILDPLDGTKNFARGDEAFGLMLAWVVQGRTRAAWVTLPARRQVFVAESGGGTWRNGERLRVPATAITPPRGMFLTRYMPDGLAHEVLAASDGRFRQGSESHCAAVEYTDVVQGVNDFIVYYRLMPWDHAAPALLLEEAGGCVQHLDGSPYTPRSRDRVTVVAGDPSVAAQVRGWLGPAPG